MSKNHPQKKTSGPFHIERIMVILGFLCLALGIQAQTNSSELQPVLLVELWRHGARTPEYFGPSFFKPNQATREGPQDNKEPQTQSLLQQHLTDHKPRLGRTELTPNGMRMHYVLGKTIRGLYKDSIFSEAPKYSDYKIYSSQYQRTIISAYSHIQGLYPKGTGQVITTTNPTTIAPGFGPESQRTNYLPNTNSSLPHRQRLLPVVVINRTQDYLFMKGVGYGLCEGAHQKAKKLFSEYSKKIHKNYYDFGEQLEAAGHPCSEFFPDCGLDDNYDLKHLGDFADVNKCTFYDKGRALIGMKPYYDQLRWIFGISYIAQKYINKQAQKMYTTHIAESVLLEIEKKMQNKSELKFVGFSGHETNVIPFMLGYGLTSLDCQLKKFMAEYKTSEEAKEGKGQQKCEMSPAFAANFIWELSHPKNDKKTFYVKTMYNGEVIQSCRKMTKDGYCPYEKFKDYFVERLVMTRHEFNIACSGKNELNYLLGNRMFLIACSLALIFIGMVLYVVFVMFSFFYLKLKKSRVKSRRGKGKSRSVTNNNQTRLTQPLTKLSSDASDNKAGLGIEGSEPPRQSGLAEAGETNED